MKVDSDIKMLRIECIYPKISIAQVNAYLKIFLEKDRNQYIESEEILERDESGIPTLKYIVEKYPMVTKRDRLFTI
tara:strand:+ start:243 stop:470 length:228 start_codon:yes stop_codon:yes gene_type:complete